MACSLASDGSTDRAAQWHRALDGATRTSLPDGVQVTVPIDRLAAVTELAAAEQACCPFFDFQLHLDGPDLHVRIRTQAEGRDMLAALFDPCAC